MNFQIPAGSHFPIEIPDVEITSGPRISKNRALHVWRNWVSVTFALALFLVCPISSFAQSPSISGFSPVSAAGVGFQLIIGGSGFGASQGGSTVTFNGVAATVGYWSDSQLIAIVPAGATTGPVVVTVGGVASNGLTFTITTTPLLTGFSPGPSGGVGTQIYIGGSNFGDAQGTSTVTFNGVAATTQYWTPDILIATIPAGATTGPVVVTIGGVASNPLTFTVVSTPQISGLSPVSAAGIGFPLYIGGSNFGATQGSSTITFNGVAATVQNWNNSQIQATVPTGATTGPIVVTVGGVASNGFTFTVNTTPLLTSFSPGPFGSIGSQLYIGGSNFGPTQGSSTITFNGTTATPLFWSDDELIVNVPTAATSGNVVVTVGGVASNPLSFTVLALPSIVATASPAANSSGWNNSNVTVTFTCTPATGGPAITTCPSPQTVSTEGTSQVISGTVIDAAGSQASTSVTLNIDKTIPALAITSPDDGSTAANSTVTVTGTVGDSLSGDSGVTCNGTAAPLSGGAFSCNISVNVGVNLVIVRATDVAGNVAGSNFHVTLPGTLPAPTSLSVTPNGVNMLVNDTQQFTAVDDQGRPRSDATWVVSDTTLATIDTDSSPTLTAVAVGQVTLTANVGSVSAQTVVTILSGTSMPIGTIRWSAPPVPGSTPVQVLQAAPVTGGPDLYSFARSSDGSSLQITALAADGRSMWSTSVANGFAGVPTGFNAQPAPVGDGNGGTLVPVDMGRDTSTSLEKIAVSDFDSQTGTKIWEYDSAGNIPGRFAVGPDGKIYFTETTLQNANHPGAYFGRSLVSLDGTTGQVLARYPVAASTLIEQESCNGHPDVFSNTNSSALSDPVIGPDGTVFASVFVLNEIQGENSTCSGSAEIAYTWTLSILQITPDGSSSLRQFHQELYPGTGPISFPTSFAAKVIPDGQGGVLTSWGTISQAFESPEVIVYHVADVSPAGVNNFTVPNPPEEMILGENGIAYLNFSGGANAFNVADGTSLWEYDSPSEGSTHLVNAVAGGGVILNDSILGLISVDAAGNPTVTGTIATAPSPWSLGNWVGVANDPVTAMFVGPSLSSTLVALSDFPMLQGNRQSQSAPQKLSVRVFITVAPGFAADPLFGTTAAAGGQISSSLPKNSVDLRLFLDTGPLLATRQNFIDNVASPLDVVGFIGHADLAATPTGPVSVGLFFTDGAMVDKIKTAATIIFIGSCDTSSQFLSLWDINSPNGGRALVVPDLAVMSTLNPGFPPITQGSVDLVQATFAFEQIAIELSQGYTIQKAVTDANTFVKTTYTNNSGMQVNPLAQWTVAPGGDNNARTKPQN